MDGIFRDQNGFSYELIPQSEDNSVAKIRDRQDEFFASVEYVPSTQQYTIMLDGGYTSKEDLGGLLQKMSTVETEVPVMSNTIGNLPPKKIENWEQTEYAAYDSAGETIEIENLKEDEKTLISIHSEERNIASAAEAFINKFNPPAIEAELQDPYAETWAPYSNAKIINNNDNDREETLEEVFNTALDLVEKELEPQQVR